MRWVWLSGKLAWSDYLTRIKQLTVYGYLTVPNDVTGEIAARSKTSNFNGMTIHHSLELDFILWADQAFWI